MLNEVELVSSQRLAYKRRPKVLKVWEPCNSEKCVRETEGERKEREPLRVIMIVGRIVEISNWN